MLRRVVLLVVVACAVSQADAGATSLRELLGGRSAIAAADLTVPAAWAGIWSYEDTSRTCGEVTGTPGDGLDTLCTGDPAGPESGGFFNWDCTGTIDDTHFSITCTASYMYLPGCTANFTFAIEATRTGDTYVSTATLNTVYSPPGCLFQQDMCMVTTTYGTRIAGPPEQCASPVQPLTWGAMKALYR